MGLCLSRRYSNLGNKQDQRMLRLFWRRWSCLLFREMQRTVAQSKEWKAWRLFQHKLCSEPCKTSTMEITVWLKFQTLKCSTSQGTVHECCIQIQYSLLELTDGQLPACLAWWKEALTIDTNLLNSALYSKGSLETWQQKKSEVLSGSIRWGSNLDSKIDLLGL